MNDLHNKEISKTFYEKEMQKTSQKCDKNNDKLVVKWTG